MPFLSKLLCSASLFLFHLHPLLLPPLPSPCVHSWCVIGRSAPSPGVIGGCDTSPRWSEVTPAFHTKRQSKDTNTVWFPLIIKGQTWIRLWGNLTRKKKKCLVRESQSQYSWKIILFFVFRMVNTLNKHVGEVKELIWNIIAVQYFFQNRAKTPVDACKTPGLSLCSSRHK